MKKVEEALIKIPEKDIFEVMKYLNLLGRVGILFLGAMGLIRYSTKIIPISPFASYCLGIIGMIVGFFLLVAVGFCIWKDSILAYPKKRKYALVLGWIPGVFGVLLGIGFIFFAGNLKFDQPVPKNSQTISFWGQDKY